MKRWLLLTAILTSVIIIITGCVGSPGYPPLATPPATPPGTIASPPFTATLPTPGTSPATPPQSALPTTENTSVANGQNIYFYSVSASGERITYTGGPGGMMQFPLSCATCHGPEGHGGTVQIMMQTWDVPDITWPELTGPDPDMEHPPYTEQTLEQAIIQGIDPGGKPLDYPMPRWQMSGQDLNDLVSFIKTLK